MNLGYHVQTTASSGLNFETRVVGRACIIMIALFESWSSWLFESWSWWLCMQHISVTLARVGSMCHMNPFEVLLKQNGLQRQHVVTSYTVSSQWFSMCNNVRQWSINVRYWDYASCIKCRITALLLIEKLSIHACMHAFLRFMHRSKVTYK